MVVEGIGRLSVTVSNALIRRRLVEHKAKLSVTENKIMNAIMSQAKPGKKECKPFVFTLSELEAITGVNRANLYKEIVKNCKNLCINSFVIEEPTGECLISSWLAYAKYDPKKATVTFCISECLKEQIIDLSTDSTTYPLKCMMSLGSRYSMRMYEMSHMVLSDSDVESGTYEKSKELSLDEMKGFLGVSVGKYDRFVDLRKRVLDSACLEVSTKTDRRVSLKFAKKGRAFSHVRLTVKSQTEEKLEEKNSKDGLMSSAIDENLRNMLKAILPNIDQGELDALTDGTYSREIVNETALELMSAKIRNETPNEEDVSLLKLVKEKAERQLFELTSPETTTEA